MNGLTLLIVIVVFLVIVRILANFLKYHNQGTTQNWSDGAAPSRTQADLRDGAAPGHSQQNWNDFQPPVKRDANGLFDEPLVQPPSQSSPPPPVTPPAAPPVWRAMPPAQIHPPAPVPQEQPPQSATDNRWWESLFGLPGTVPTPQPPLPPAPIIQPTIADETKSPPGSPGTAPTPALPPLPTEAVRFTAFHPKEIAVTNWYTLLVYAHLDSAIDQVRTDAARFKQDMGTDTPRESRAATPAQLARGTEITIVPTCDGVSFNPERVTLKWIEDVHRADFRFQAAKALAGQGDTLLVSIYVGPLVIAAIKSGLNFNDILSAPPAVPSPLIAVTLPQPDANNTTATAVMYRSDQIFISYSHQDTDVINTCRTIYEALGYDVLIDIEKLKSGQEWNAELLNMIDKAEIFQLFWSARAAQSKYVQQEWQHALERAKRENKVGFIRPVWWEKPLVPPPSELSNLHFAYMPLLASGQAAES